MKLPIKTSKNKPESSIIIDEPRKLLIPDESGKSNHITMVINWNKNIKDCEYIKLIYPDGSESIVQKDRFRSIMFLIANQEEREKMARQRITTVRTIKKNYTIEFNKDTAFRKGEKAIIPVAIQVPVSIQDEVLDSGEREGFKPR